VITAVAGLVLPVIMPVSNPEDDPILATVGAELDQVPPLPLVSVVDAPWQIAIVPEMAGGAAFTVTCCTAKQPVDGSVYEMVAVPPLTATPVTVPVVPDPATEAVPGAELVHEPPGVASPSAVVAPVHTVGVPVMAEGAALTVTTVLSVVQGVV
jgi:hypothetical protein